MAGASPSVVAAQAAQFYQSRYILAGFLLRAAAVCNSGKRTVDAAMNLLGTAELMAMSKAYPNTTEAWMSQGAGTFNNGVMTDGVGAACAYATTVRRQAEKIAKGGG